MLPCIGWTRPETARSVVVFPAPLAPSSATTSPGCDGEVEVADDGRAVVAGGQAVDLEHGCSSRTPPASRSGRRTASAGRSAAAPPRYALTTTRVPAHLVRRAGRDHLAELEHDDAVADAEHEPHVVVDRAASWCPRRRSAAAAGRAPRSRACRGRPPARRGRGGAGRIAIARATPTSLRWPCVSSSGIASASAREVEQLERLVDGGARRRRAVRRAQPRAPGTTGARPRR